MQSLPEDRIVNLISSLYDAAEQSDPGAWAPICTQIADLTSAEEGSLNILLNDNEEYRVITGTFEPDFHREYVEYFHSINPFKNDVLRMRSGDRLNRRERISDDVFCDLEFYQDYYRKHNIFHFEHRVFLAENGVACSLTLTRPKTRDNFSREELLVLKLLMPHLQRAFHLYLNDSDVKWEHGVLSETLDYIPRSVVIVDRDKNVIFANRQAKSLLQQQDGLAIDKTGRLLVSASDDGRKFRRAIDKVFATDNSPELVRGGTLHISRPSGRRSLQMLISPLAGNKFPAGLKKTLALIFISDPAEMGETEEGVLASVHGLTHAESRIASVLAGGGTLDDACDQLQITRNTARTHLKHIFAKTYTNRQSELVKLILRGPASIRRPE